MNILELILTMNRKLSSGLFDESKFELYDLEFYVWIDELHITTKQSDMSRTYIDNFPQRKSLYHQVRWAKQQQPTK